MKQKMLTAKEVADHLQIGISSVYKLAKMGQIPALKVMNKWRFEWEAIEGFTGGQSRNTAIETARHV